MDLSAYQNPQARRPAKLPINVNRIPSIDEIQQNLIQGELEAAQ